MLASNSQFNRTFDLLHVDNIKESYYVSPVYCQKYFLTTISDNYTQFTRIILVKSKAKTRQQIQQFITYLETQFRRIVYNA